jgi:uncharacterized coiled-coil protein SlyX
VKSANEQVLPRLEKVKKGERVIGAMTTTIVASFLEIEQMRDDLQALLNKAKRMDEMLDARRTLFWNQVRTENEQAESADSRGLSIGVRKKIDSDGIDRPVLVEFKAEASANPLLSILKQLRDGMDQHGQG